MKWKNMQKHCMQFWQNVQWKLDIFSNNSLIFEFLVVFLYNQNVFFFQNSRIIQEFGKIFGDFMNRAQASVASKTYISIDVKKKSINLYVCLQLGGGGVKALADASVIQDFILPSSALLKRPSQLKIIIFQKSYLIFRVRFAWVWLCVPQGKKHSKNMGNNI